MDAGLVMESTGEIDDAGAVPRPLAAEDDGGVGARKPRVVSSEMGRTGGSTLHRRICNDDGHESRRRHGVTGRAPRPRLRAASSGNMATPAPH